MRRRQTLRSRRPVRRASASRSAPSFASTSPISVICGGAASEPPAIDDDAGDDAPFRRRRRAGAAAATAPPSGNRLLPSLAMRPTGTSSTIVGAAAREPHHVAVLDDQRLAAPGSRRASSAWPIRWRASPCTGIAIRGRTIWYIARQLVAAGWPETWTK